MTVTSNDKNAIAAIGAELYASTPKSVLALIAYHFAAQLAGEDSDPLAAIANEWQALHLNGIIPQAPSRKLPPF